MEPKLINEDPLNPAKNTKLNGIYETPLFYLDISNNDMVVYFIKYKEELKLYGSMKQVLNAFKNIIKKEAAWVIAPCTYIIKEIKRGNGAFNWYEVSFRCKIETGSYPIKWNKEDIMSHILKHEMSDIEVEVRELRELLIAHLCMMGQILIYPVTYMGMPYMGMPHQNKIAYKGFGYQNTELIGCGGIAFYADKVKICQYYTWEKY